MGLKLINIMNGKVFVSKASEELFDDLWYDEFFSIRKFLNCAGIKDTKVTMYQLDPKQFGEFHFTRRSHVEKLADCFGWQDGQYIIAYRIAHVGFDGYIFSWIEAYRFSDPFGVGSHIYESDSTFYGMDPFDDWRTAPVSINGEETNVKDILEAGKAITGEVVIAKTQYRGGTFYVVNMPARKLVSRIEMVPSSEDDMEICIHYNIHGTCICEKE